MKGKKLFITCSMMLFAVILLAGCNKKNFNVTFSNAQSTNTTQTVEEGKTINKPSAPTKEGYSFLGWFLGDTEYDFSKPIKGDITLTAKWQKVEVKDSYTVEFDSDGGSSVKSLTIKAGQKALEPTIPTKSGYTFSYWKYNNTKFDFSSNVTKDMKLVAVWTKDSATTPDKPNKPEKPEKPETPDVPSVKPVTYKVTFDSNGGSNVASKTVDKGSSVASPSAPTKAGFNFIGWTLNGNAYNFSSGVTSNITLVAKWEAIPVADKYTYTVSKLDDYTRSRNILVYKNGVNITKTAAAIYTASGSYLGRWEDAYQAIIIDERQISSVGAIKINGKLIKF